MESVRNRVSQHGVSVVTVKPGPVHTPMTEGIEALPMAIAAEAAAEGVYAAIKTQENNPVCAGTVAIYYDSDSMDPFRRI